MTSPTLSPESVAEFRRMVGDWGLCSGTVRNALEAVLDAYEALAAERNEAVLALEIIAPEFDQLTQPTATEIGKAAIAEVLALRAEIASLRLKLANATCDALTTAHAEITRLRDALDRDKK